MSAYIWPATVLLAFVLLPFAYVGLCLWMYLKKVWWFTYCAYFYVFGAFGGWCLMLAAAMMGPGIGAVSALGMELFLITAAIVGCLACSLVLQFRMKKNRFDLGAMYGGYAYIVLHGTWLTFTIYSAATAPHV